MLRHRPPSPHRDLRRLARRLTGRSLVVVIAAALPAPAEARVRVTISPRAPQAGAPFTVRLRGSAEAVRVCVSSAAGVARCVRMSAPGSLALSAPRTGRWRLTVRGDGVRLTRPLRVRPIGPKLSVLAVGDSMMVRVARHLSRQLEGPHAHVTADIHLGASISDDFVLDWRAQARATVARAPADVVVVFLGGSEGWPFGSVDCCGPAWMAEYSARAREIMRTYVRGGASQVYWLNLPAARDPKKTAALRAANEGLARASSGLEPWTRLVDVAGLLTPGYVFRDSMLVDGEPVTLRMADGLHLSRAAAIYGARMVAARLREDEVLPDPGYRRG